MTHPRDRFSLIGHAALPFMSPLEVQEVLALLRAASLGEGDHVLDVGAGRGDLAILAARTFGCRATSVDRSPAACDAARERAGTLPITIECSDGVALAQAAAPRSFALACAVGAVHAFGEGAASFRAADAALSRIASRVLVADLVALGPRAVEAFEVAPLEALSDLRARAIEHVVLPPARVAAYEAAWARGLSRHLDAHPDDPRADWARDRIAWTTTAELRDARAELAFAAFLL